MGGNYYQDNIFHLMLHAEGHSSELPWSQKKSGKKKNEYSYLTQCQMTQNILLDMLK